MVRVDLTNMKQSGMNSSGIMNHQWNSVHISKAALLTTTDQYGTRYCYPSNENLCRCNYDLSLFFKVLFEKNGQNRRFASARFTLRAIDDGDRLF